MLSEGQRARCRTVLRSWLGTEYCDGQAVRGVAANCVGFWDSALSDARGRRPEVSSALRYPRDLSIHDPAASLRAMATFLRHHKPRRRVDLEKEALEDMDTLVFRSITSGVGHVGLFFEGKVWHSGNRRVCRVSLDYMRKAMRLSHVYRCLDVESWPTL
jgi:hypothetical protein